MQKKGGICLGSLFLNHTVGLIAMAVGYVLLVVEMCIPGFGVPGTLGTVLAVLGLIVLRPTALQALVIVVIYVALLCVALAICMHSVARGRISKSRLVLNDVATHADTPETNDLTYFIGRTGTARSTLRPAGIAEFDGVRLNVVSDCDFIEQGAAVRVDRVEGKRIVVSQIQESQAG